MKHKVLVQKQLGIIVAVLCLAIRPKADLSLDMWLVKDNTP